MSSPHKHRPLFTSYSGPSLLETPLLNKGTAFTKEERIAFNLMGLLPSRYETIEEQLERAYHQYSSFHNPINKHIYLRAIQDNNETLYYRLVKEHLKEMMPIIYTPTVGDACEHFSDIYQSARGIFISYADRGHLDDVIHSVTKARVKVIVVTDGERVLGLGDQGIGGMGISIGKLSLYTACGGISPAYTLPVCLDVGTNNEKLLNDPMYMGLRHKRVAQEDYDDFVDEFIQAVVRRWPEVMVQFEDFAQPNAMPLLKKYRDKICCFNDDIQGTAAVTVGTLLAACKVKKVSLSSQKVVFVGAGSAGCGIAEQIVSQMVKDGSTIEQARSQVFLLDRGGLINEKMMDLRDFQKPLAQPASILEQWSFEGEYPGLIDVIHNAKPDILIGVSGAAGIFTEQVVHAMKKHCKVPIIFPLSNPSKQIEARPEQIIEWTRGEVIVATGSPFAPIEYQGDTYPIAQCNNAYIFPGVGLGVIASRSRRVTEEMLSVASHTLAEASPLANSGTGGLLPDLTDLANLSKKIAFNVGKIAQEQGHALEIPDDELKKRIESNFWIPTYREYKRVSY